MRKRMMPAALIAFLLAPTFALAGGLGGLPILAVAVPMPEDWGALYTLGFLAMVMLAYEVVRLLEMSPTFYRDCFFDLTRNL